MSIEVRNLTHAYSEATAMRTVALEDVCMTVEDGEFLGIIGHTGSGKSTLVQHLNGLLKPTSGQVLVDGEDLNGEHVNRRILRQRIGLVFNIRNISFLKKQLRKISLSVRRTRACRKRKLTSAFVMRWNACIWTFRNTAKEVLLNFPAVRCGGSLSQVLLPCVRLS